MISNREDIVKEVAGRLNIKEEKVGYVFDFLIEHMKKMMWLRGIVSLTLPHLGRIYLKNAKIKKEITRLRNLRGKITLNRADAIRLSKYETKLKELSENAEGGTSKLKNHYTKPKLRIRNLNMGKSLEELENWQNEEEI